MNTQSGRRELEPPELALDIVGSKFRPQTSKLIRVKRECEIVRMRECVCVREREEGSEREEWREKGREGLRKKVSKIEKERKGFRVTDKMAHARCITDHTGIRFYITLLLKIICLTCHDLRR